jgi:hypothetical protein
MAAALLLQAGTMVPFKGICIGEWSSEPGVIAEVSGYGTLIGRFTGQLLWDSVREGMVVVLRAPDGSEVWADIAQRSDGVNGGVGTIIPEKNTGRFAGATGQWLSTWDPQKGTPTGWIETFLGQISTIGSNKR